jgi:hypothetical protein
MPKVAVVLSYKVVLRVQRKSGFSGLNFLADYEIINSNGKRNMGFSKKGGV